MIDSTLNNIDSILFDLDGTLINSLEIMFLAYSNFLNSFNIKATREEFNLLNGPSLKEISLYLGNKHQLMIEPDQLLSLYTLEIKKLYNSVNEIDGATRLLNLLHSLGIKVFIVTSNLEEICMPLIKKLGWESVITNYVWGDSVNESKPSPKIYIHALKKFNLESSKTLVLEDSLNGVLSAHQAHLKVIQVGEDIINKSSYALGTYSLNNIYKKIKSRNQL